MLRYEIYAEMCMKMSAKICEKYTEHAMHRKLNVRIKKIKKK